MVIHSARYSGCYPAEQHCTREPGDTKPSGLLGPSAIRGVFTRTARQTSAASSGVRSPVQPVEHRLQPGEKTPLGLRTLPSHTCRVARQDRKSTRLNSSHVKISYAVF